MVQTIILAFLGGLLAGNGIPHFIKGITREEYPNMTGNSPTRNVASGWAAFMIAALLLYFAHVEAHPLEAFIASSLGLLCISVFHAQGGAFRLNTRFGRVNPGPGPR